MRRLIIALVVVVIAVALFLMTVGIPIKAKDFKNDGAPTPQSDTDSDGDGIPDVSDPDLDGDGIPNINDPEPDSPMRPVAVVVLDPIRATNIFLLGTSMGGEILAPTLSYQPYNATINPVYQWRQWRVVKAMPTGEDRDDGLPDPTYLDVQYFISVEIRSAFESSRFMYSQGDSQTKTFSAWWNCSVVTVSLSDNGVAFGSHNWGSTGRAYLWEYGQYEYHMILWTKLPGGTWVTSDTLSLGFHIGPTIQTGG